MKNNKHILSFITVLLFLFLAVGSAPNSQLQLGFFNYYKSVEEKEKDDVYLIKNDGTKVYGKKIDFQTARVLTNHILIDGQKFKPSDIKAYRDGSAYYVRLDKSEFAKRIVHGKINVYIHIYQVETNGRYNTRGSHYAQIGETGSLKKFDMPKEIKELVAGCPLSEQMMDDVKSLRKTIKEDVNFLNRVFETYNNNCKPVK